MSAHYEIVPYEPKLKEQVVDLQTNLWSPSRALNTAYFEWKHERNPYVTAPLVYLAMHDGRVVGMRGFFGVEWEAGLPPQRFPGLYADDLVIAPAHRNQGLVHRIMATALKDLASRGHRYLFNLTAGPVTFVSSLSMGWRSAGSMQPMCWLPWSVELRRRVGRIVRRIPLASDNMDRLRSRWSARRSPSVADMDRERLRRFSRSFPCISLEQTPRCAGMADLVERIGRRGRIQHVRDRRYFEWRFQNPLSRYRFLYWDKAGLDGYLVLQEYTSEFAEQGVLNVADWEGSDATVQAGLLRAAKRCAGQRRLDAWSATLPPEKRAVLAANGFTLVRHAGSIAQQCPALLVRPVRDEDVRGEWLLAGRGLLDLENWDVRMLYSMHG